MSDPMYRCDAQRVGAASLASPQHAFDRTDLRTERAVSPSSGPGRRVTAGLTVAALSWALVPGAFAQTPQEPSTQPPVQPSAASSTSSPASPPDLSLDPSRILTTERPTRDQCVEEVRMKRRIGLGITGAAIFGGTYMINVFVASLGVPNLYIPIAGPIVEAVSARSGDGPAYVAVLDSLVQAGGLAMMIAGFATKKRSLIYRDTEIAFAPYAGSGGAGLFAMGRF